ncbi:MAG: hypothetical protein MK193_01655 [Lentisphaeria bacterium]|nr:hypothetical protein [Lentisphaeria bacterium]
MSSQVLSILIGGVLAALLLGISSILQKVSNSSGISPSQFIFFAGLSIALSGALVWGGIQYESQLTSKAVIYACLFGVVWAAAAFCVSISISRYGANISQLVSLFNMNTLVGVVLGLIIFREYQQVNTPMLLVGATLIFVGGILCAKA